MNKKKSVLTGTFMTIVLIITGYLYIKVPSEDIGISTDPEISNMSNLSAEESQSDFKIYYIDVGQADSILITSQDSSMLIDAGNNADGKDVVNFIKSLNISNLDYVIGTHPHEDHIGGLDDVIKSFEIGKVLMPKVQNNTKTFEEVLDAISNKGLKITSPAVGDTFTLGESKFTILSCKTDVEDELNLSSIVIRVEYGNCSYLFCGDAETENENEMLLSGQVLKSDIIKIGHHGSTSSSSESFIKAVAPKAAIICVGTDNDYGHPHQKTLDTLKKYGITIYRTDTRGNIAVTSDGNTSKIFVEKS